MNRCHWEFFIVSSGAGESFAAVTSFRVISLRSRGAGIALTFRRYFSNVAVFLSLSFSIAPSFRFSLHPPRFVS